jgi:hypothetical protein
VVCGDSTRKASGAATPGTRLPDGKIVIDVHTEPSRIWLQADPVSGEVTVDLMRSGV